MAREPIIVMTADVGSTPGWARTATMATTPSSATAAMAAKGERSRKFAKIAVTTRAPMTMEAIKTGISACPSISMALVASPPGVSSMTPWAREAKIDGTPW